MEQWISTAEVKEAAGKALQYVHSCQTEDGGYFFARIPPGSLRDSYFAVKSLQMLGERPRRPADLEYFVRSFLQETVGNPVHTGYLATEIFNCLSKDLEPLRQQTQVIEASLTALQEVTDSRSLYLEVASELETIFEAVSVLLNLGVSFDRTAAIKLIASMSNKDGGFGSRGSSSLATTYYAVRTFALLDYVPKQPERTFSFLKSQQRDLYFLEDLYYLSSSCFILGKTLSAPEQALSFVLNCQRDSGGFARARAMGIPTLEDTYYALSVLKQLDALE